MQDVTMAILKFCCCASSRSVRTPSLPESNPQDALSRRQPPPRAPGPLSMNPVGSVAAAGTRHNPPQAPLQPSIRLVTAQNHDEPVQSRRLSAEKTQNDEEIDAGAQSRGSDKLQRVKNRSPGEFSQELTPRRKAISAVESSQVETDRQPELKRLLKNYHGELDDEGLKASSKGPSTGPRQPPSSLAVQRFPGGGSHDSSEFSVGESTKPDRTLVSDPRLHKAHPEPKSTSASNLSDTAYRASPKHGHKSENQKNARELTCIIDAPSSDGPGCTPDKLITSWRLACSTERLKDTLSYAKEVDGRRDEDAARDPTTRLLPENSTIASVGLAAAITRFQSPGITSGEQSPYSIWLRAQELRPQGPSTTRTLDSDDAEFLEDAVVQEAEVVYIRKCSMPRNISAPEVDGRNVPVVHVQHVGIRRQLGTDSSLQRAEHCKSASEVELDTKQRAGGSVTRKPVAAGVRAVATPEQMPPGSRMDTSSAYFSTAASEYPASDVSGVRRGSVVNKEPPSTLFLPSDGGFKWPRDSQPYSIAGGSEPNLRDALGRYPVNKPAAADTRAGTPWPSFHHPMPGIPNKPHDKSHPDTVEKSIGYFHLQHGTPTLVVHDFSKGLNPRPPRPVSGKPSVLERLRLSFPQRIRSPPPPTGPDSDGDGTALEAESEVSLPGSTISAASYRNKLRRARRLAREEKSPPPAWPLGAPSQIVDKAGGVEFRGRVSERQIRDGDLGDYGQSSSCGTLGTTDCGGGKSTTTTGQAHSTRSGVYNNNESYSGQSQSQTPSQRSSGLTSSLPRPRPRQSGYPPSSVRDGTTEQQHKNWKRVVGVQVGSPRKSSATGAGTQPTTNPTTTTMAAPAPGAGVGTVAPSQGGGPESGDNNSKQKRLPRARAYDLKQKQVSGSPAKAKAKGFEDEDAKLQQE